MHLNCFDKNINVNRDVKFLDYDDLLVQRCMKLTLDFKTYNPMVQWAAVKTHPSLIKVPPQKLNPDGFIKAAWYLISPGKTSLP